MFGVTGRRLLALAAALCICAAPGFARRVNITITITAGTPVQISAQPKIANRIFVQMVTGGTGRGYVMDGIPVGVTPDPTVSGQLTAELAPATATAPGGTYTDGGPGTTAATNGGIDLQRFWVGGSNTGDKIIVSYDERN